jgi:glucose-6-phosphate 1-dehydrogenase
VEVVQVLMVECDALTRANVQIAQSIMTLRFANLVFELLLNRQHIGCVHISFKEDIGTQGRGGYFDEYGMIRDVMQNHLMQLLALVAMEPPISRSADDVRNRECVSQAPSLSILTL